MVLHRAGRDSTGSDGSWAHVPMEMAEWYILGIAEGERRAAERMVPHQRRASDREPAATTAELRIIRGGRGA